MINCSNEWRGSWKSLQFSSVAQSCLTVCTPGLPVHHQFLKSTQTHVHRVGDANQPSHPLLSPSPPALNLSQHQGLFKWVSSLHQVAKGLEFWLQPQCFQWTPRTDLLQDGLVGPPCSPRGSQESSPTPQFKRISSSALSFLYSPTLTSVHDHWKNHSLDQKDLCWQSDVWKSLHSYLIKSVHLGTICATSTCIKIFFSVRFAHFFRILNGSFLVFLLFDYWC